MESAIGGLIGILLYSLLLLGLQRIHHVLVEILDLLKEGRDSQEKANQQQHLGLTYLYAIAKQPSGKGRSLTNPSDPESENSGHADK